ncbi:MAG: DegV family protein [Anaerolineae bacterium]
MPRFAIVTDTDASLPAGLAAQHGITLVPITIEFDGDSLRADFDIADEALFERIAREGRLPTTSAPSPGAFSTAFEQALSSGVDGVICYTVSSAISATFAAAQTASNLVDPARITVVDSASVSMIQGYMALAAAEAAARGADRETILAAALATRDRAVLYGALSTLKYLAMGGRVPQFTASMANLLNIRPILTMREGKLDLLEKVRTRKNAWARMVELCRRDVGEGRVDRWALVHVNAREDALAFGEQLRASLPLPGEPLVVPLGPGLAVHTGDGTIVVVLLKA